MATKTFTVTACMPVIYSGGDGVNPGDLHLPIGKWDPSTGIGYSTRLLLKASISLAGMTAINEARLYLYQHTAAGWHAKGSGGVLVGSRRKSSDWSESSGGSSTATDEIYGGDSGSLVSGGFADDGTPDYAIDNGAGDGTLDYIGITAIARKWLAGSPNYGVMLYAADSSTDPNDACEFYSRRTSGRVPYFWIDYDTNTAPNAPTGLSPSGGERTDTGRTITYSGNRSDPDSGDLLTEYQIEVWNSGHSTKIQSYTSPDYTPGYSSWSRPLTLPSGYNADRVYEWRARTRDKSNVYGPWSGFQSFRANSVPNTPPPPSVENDTLTPTISGTFSDPDGNPPNQADVHVERVETGTDYWLSGAFGISTSPWSKVYAGGALAWNVAYRARIRVRDEYGAWSSWSSWSTWTTTQPTGPSNMTPRTTTTKQNTLTPTLTVGHSAQFRNDEIEVYAGSLTSSTKLWTKPITADYAAATSKAYVYAGAALAWGTTYYWRARIEDLSGVVSAWSPLVPFRLNALPTAPTVEVAADDGTPAAVSPAGVLVTADTTPILSAAFADPDRATDGDAPSARSIEVRRKDTGAALAGYPVTTGTGETHTLTTALAADVVYEARIGYRDNAGQPAGTYVYSAWREIKASTAPALTLTAPAMDAVVIDSTPTLDWSFAGTAGKTQATWRVAIYDRGTTAEPLADEQLVHDSGIHNGADTAYDVPAGVIADDHLYRWEVTATDSDGLPAILA